ncbi:hypothetical protein D0Z07_6123 [Hyphodiscus hymeniophilus]|uniref:F-box domain-containing protein n=1 Tax=Hyphodiscus hymeniophilus TaxID=353542 RepID=A0A9P7AUJ8_9HELO|nr:hypothetical protein D0Z07_6123 [Hyphodiscus hymeniophilus]
MAHRTNADGSVSLLSMPVEVLLQITSNLTTSELGYLRCTCKQIETTLFPSFSREFFTRRKFMFTEFSLQALIDISKSRLSSCLSHVMFSLHRPTAFRLYNAHQVRKIDEDAKSNRFIDECVGEMTLVNTDQDVEMLVEAFGNLSNLETVGLRDFDSHSRHRDAPNDAWRSYGARTFELNTGTALGVPEQRRPPFYTGDSTLSCEATHLSRVFINILRAVGKAQSRLPRFEVILRKNSLYDHAFHLPKYLEPTVDPVLAGLRTLFLDLNTAFDSYGVDVNGVPTECSSYFLRRFFSKLHELEHLRLNFRDYTTTNDILTWLSQPVTAVPSSPPSGIPFPRSPPPVDLIKLQRLDIGMTAIDSGVLLALIRKYGVTLRTISFHKISLLEPPLIAPEDRSNLWAKFFGQLSKLDLKISAINLQFLSQGPNEMPTARHVTFMDTSHSSIRNWAGPDMQSGLRDYITYTSVVGLNGKESSSDSSESNPDSKC